jgi:hypothetical protein
MIPAPITQKSFVTPAALRSPRQHHRESYVSPGGLGPTARRVPADPSPAGGFLLAVVISVIETWVYWAS